VMGDDNLLDIYNKQTETEIANLNKTIVALRTKIIILTETLEGERARAEAIPVPPTIISQVADLTAKVERQEMEIKYYEKHVSKDIIINKEKVIPKPRRGGLT
jgi:hypothetical protein